MPYKRGTPRYYYNNQKKQAKYRGIAWEFTFETWWKVWKDSGQWKNRGCRSGEYAMSRPGDIGPYSPENVIIVLHGKNSSDALIDWPAKKKAREDREAAEKRDAQTKVEDPKTLSFFPDYTRDKEVAYSSNDIAIAAQTFLENGQRYGQPQFSPLNHSVDTSSRKSSKQSNATISIEKSDKSFSFGDEVRELIKLLLGVLLTSNSNGGISKGVSRRAKHEG